MLILSVSFSHSIHAKYSLPPRAISWKDNELLEGVSHFFHFDGILGVATPSARNLCVLRKENHGLHSFGELSRAACGWMYPTLLHLVEISEWERKIQKIY